MHEIHVEYVHRILQVGVQRGGQRSSLGVLLYYNSPFRCGTGSLTEPGARCFQLDWLAREAPESVHFYLAPTGIGDTKSSPHTCTSSTLHTEPVPSSLTASFHVWESQPMSDSVYHDIHTSLPLPGLKEPRTPLSSNTSL